MTTLHDFTTVACPYEEVPARLQTYLESNDAAIALRLPLGDLRLEHDVDVRLAPKPGYPGYKLVDVTWSAKDGGPYPVFNGTLSVADEGAGWSRIDLDGAYKPPLGPLGVVFDATIGHRIAEATAAELLSQLKGILARETHAR
jgi:hypothetical protein